MKLFTALFFLIAIPLFGAVPSYDAFVGTNGISVSKFPPQGKIIIDGIGITNTAAGDTYNVQRNSNDTFVADSSYNFHPFSFFSEFVGPTLSVNNGAGGTNFMDAYGFGALGPSGTLFYSSNAAPRWQLTVGGNLVPYVYSNTYDIGTSLLPARTNWVNDLFAKENGVFLGNVGIGTTLPVAKLAIVGGGFALPATSGVAQSAGLMQRLDDTSAAVLDMGGAAGNGMWLQSVFKTDLSANLPLLLNPNGGTVAIGGLASAANSENLAVIGNVFIRNTLAVGRSSLGIVGTFEGFNTNGLNRDGVVVNIITVATESGFHDIYSVAAHNSDQRIPAGIFDSGLRVGVTGEAYSRTTNFAGKLDQQIGVRGTAGFALGTTGAVVNHAYAGYFQVRNEAPSTSISNAYGVYIANLQTIGTITNRWDLYASSTNAKNYFAGKVGIGIANPIEMLEVSLPTPSEGMTLGTSPNSFGITTIEGANNYGLFSGVGSSGNAWLQVGSRTAAIAYNLILQGSGGKVGIGTTNPASSLDVTGQVRMASAIITNTLALSGGLEFREYSGGIVGFSNTVSGAIGLYMTDFSDNFWAVKDKFMVGGAHEANSLRTTNNITIMGTTNQIIFGATNIAPASAVAPTKWISVQVSGDSGVYRLPLYQ